MTEPQEAEFDVLARWTAAELIGRDQMSRFAGASRGSGSPAALAWLAESLGLGPGRRLLDVGAGLGGPAAWASERYGVRAVAIDPMPGADRGSAQLFDHPVVAASAAALPLRSGSFDVAWALGVLDTVPSPSEVLGEVRRTLVPDGRCGLLAYVARRPIEASETPQGNHFQTEPELLADLRAAGFAVVDRTSSDSLPPVPIDWQLRQDRLEQRLRSRHGDDPAWLEAEANEHRFASLLETGDVEPVLLHALCV